MLKSSPKVLDKHLREARKRHMDDMDRLRKNVREYERIMGEQRDLECRIGEFRAQRDALLSQTVHCP